MAETMRQFESGATRSPDQDRYDPEGFLSPMVIERFSQYMHKHRFQADGNVRDSDNWQKGLPVYVWMKGMWRHMLHLWTRHRGMPVQDPKAGTDMEEDLCAILFNAQGYLHELLKQRYAKSCTEPMAAPPQKARCKCGKYNLSGMKAWVDITGGWHHPNSCEARI